jgi:hypothetical protein
MFKCSVSLLPTLSLLPDSAQASAFLSPPLTRDYHKDTTTNAFADYNQLKITVESTSQHAFQVENWKEIQQV